MIGCWGVGGYDLACRWPGGCGRGDGQTVFWSISEKNLSPKKVQKSLWKKSERTRKALVNQLCIMHSFCTLFALIMHNALPLRSSCHQKTHLNPLTKLTSYIMSPFKWHVMSHDARGPNSTHLIIDHKDGGAACRMHCRKLQGNSKDADSSPVSIGPDGSTSASLSCPR